MKMEVDFSRLTMDELYVARQEIEKEIVRKEIQMEERHGPEYPEKERIFHVKINDGCAAVDAVMLLKKVCQEMSPSQIFSRMRSGLDLSLTPTKRDQLRRLGLSVELTTNS